MKKKYDISASVVLFNTPLDEIKNIINILFSSDLRIKLYLVDNSPSDIHSENFANPDNDIEYIFTGKNLGFGTAHNIAINKAKDNSEYHLVLNADVDFESGILNTMLNFMKDNQDVGLLAPKILYPDGSIQYSCKLLPSPANLIVRRFVPIKKIQDYFNHLYEFRFWSFDKIIEVPYVMGCFMFIDCKVFEKVNGFDERFFMYPEDMDLTRRIHEKYKTLYFPEVTIFHKHGKGSYKSNRLLYYHVTSMIKYFNKWGWIFDSDRHKVNKKILSQFER